MSNKTSKPKRTATCESCGADILVGSRGPLPRHCKPCGWTRANIRAASERRGRFEEREWLAKRIEGLGKIQVPLQVLLNFLDDPVPLPNLEATVRELVGPAYERVSAEIDLVQERKDALETRQRELERRSRERERRRYREVHGRR